MTTLKVSTPYSDRMDPEQLAESMAALQRRDKAARVQAIADVYKRLNDYYTMFEKDTAIGIGECVGIVSRMHKEATNAD